MQHKNATVVYHQLHILTNSTKYNESINQIRENLRRQKMKWSLSLD